jgi:hypothetical protein
MEHPTIGDAAEPVAVCKGGTAPGLEREDP